MKVASASAVYARRCAAAPRWRYAAAALAEARCCPAYAAAGEMMSQIAIAMLSPLPDVYAIRRYMAP